MNLLENLFRKLLDAGTYINKVPLDVSSTAYTNDNGFYLYVGTAGNVAYTDWNGNVKTAAFGIGYHPVKLKKIDTTANGTTASGLSANW